MQEPVISQSYAVDAAGALACRPIRTASGLTLEIELFMKECRPAKLEMTFLDSLRSPIMGPGIVPKIQRQLEMGRLYPQVTAASQRIHQALSPAWLAYGHCAIEIPNRLRRAARYCSFSVNQEACGVVSARASDRVFYVERRKIDFGLGIRSTDRHYAFLLTMRQRHRRIEAIAKRTPNHRSNPDAADALSRLAFNIYGGYDTPLLTKER